MPATGRHQRTMDLFRATTTFTEADCPTVCKDIEVSNEAKSYPSI